MSISVDIASGVGGGLRVARGRRGEVSPFVRGAGVGEVSPVAGWRHISHSRPGLL